MEALRMHLFGGFLLERNGVAVPPIASRAGRSLFAYLVMNRDRPLQRDFIAGTFWPDLSEGKARRRLSQTLWQIQDAVNVGAESQILVHSDALSFDTSKPYWLDVEEFDRNFEASGATGNDPANGQRLDITALRACVDLYRGDFLAGFFDDWVILDQDHYRQRYLVSLRKLVDATKADGAYEEALANARRLTHHDPLTEEVHREVMRLCFLLGRTGEAIEQFERCRAVLTEELGTEPTQPTVDLYRRIVRHRAAGIRPAHVEDEPIPLDARLATPFVGREEERRTLVDSMERVLAGPGGVVLVEGEPGVGKTRLATEAADDAQWRGFQVSWGACTEGTLRPFASLTGVLESLTQLRIEQLSEQIAPIWLRESFRLAPRLSEDNSEASPSAPLRPAEESTRMKEALVHTLGALGKISPHLIIIDDVQWADHDTLSVLTQLGPRLARSRILLLLLYRSEEARGDAEAWHVLRDLDRVAGLGRVVLSSLSVFELDEMVKRVMGVTYLEPRVSAQLHRRTGGNALFTLEALLSLRDQGLFDGADPAEVLQNHVHDEALPIAPRVRSVINARVSLLGPRPSTIYEVAAVCGDPADLALLSAGADMPRGDVVDAVDELVHRGLIRDVGDATYAFAHDQVRQVIYEAIDPEHRSMLHRRVAQALEESTPLDVEAIGHHFREGGDASRSAPYLLESGLKAARLNAYATANQYLQSARLQAASAGWTAMERCRLLGELETVLGVLGRRDDQWDVISEMEELAGDRPAILGDVERREAWLFAHVSDFDRAEAASLRSVSIEKELDDPASTSASLVALGTILRWSGRPLHAVRFLEDAVAAAADKHRNRADAQTELASTFVEVQQPSASLSHLREAVAHYESEDDLRGQAEVAGIQARAFHQQGEPDQARECYKHAIELCRRIGYRHGEGLNLVNLSLLEHMMGRVADAMPGYAAAERIFDELGNTRGEAMVLANASSARHNILGDDERALADTTRAVEQFVAIGDRAREAQCMEIMAGISSRQGRPEEARRLLEQSLDALEGTGNVYLEGQHLRSLILLQIDQEEPSDALATLDRAEQLCNEAGLDDLVTELSSIRGTALLALSRDEEALTHTRRAVEMLTPGVERPYLVHHRHAKTARARGEANESRQAAVLALETLGHTLDGLTEVERARALEVVSEHAEIVRDGDKLIPHTILVELPMANAPIGKALDAGDMREITWTIGHPDDDDIESPQERRRRTVMRLLAEADEGGTIPSIEHLAHALGVSQSTIRRDLSALRHDGFVVITRGNRDKAS